MASWDGLARSAMSCASRSRAAMPQRRLRSSSRLSPARSRLSFSVGSSWKRSTSALASIGQGDQLVSTVVGVGVALDVACFHEPLDEAAGRGQADVELRGQGGDGHRRPQRHEQEAARLRHGHVDVEHVEVPPARHVTHEQLEAGEDVTAQDVSRSLAHAGGPVGAHSCCSTNSSHVLNDSDEMNGPAPGRPSRLHGARGTRRPGRSRDRAFPYRCLGTAARGASPRRLPEPASRAEHPRRSRRS